MSGARATPETPETRERLVGCVLGLALGDAFGAPHEGGPVERLAWRCIGGTRRGRRRYTDDTQMTRDLCESLLACGGVNEDDIARRFAAGYRWSRGYGPGAAKLLKRVRRGVDWRDARTSVYPDGSYGNGGAMRVPVIGLLYKGDALVDAATRVASVTHAHPKAIEGAVLIARATRLFADGVEDEALFGVLLSAVRDEAFRTRLVEAAGWRASATRPSAREARRVLGNGVAAEASCVTAVWLAAETRGGPFEAVVRRAVELRGDVDTIAAMAGAMWGAANGAAALPDAWLARLEDADAMRRLAGRLQDAW